MSSSISSSEAVDPHWRRFVVVFVAATALLLAGTLGFLAALDPYDTGRLELVQRAGVAEQGPRTANASRGRDPHFDSAIFGNSHAQLLRPETLKDETGLNFVSLIVPGTYPKEQFRAPRPGSAIEKSRSIPASATKPSPETSLSKSGAVSRPP
jgi:hypothetical protein